MKIADEQITLSIQQHTYNRRFISSKDEADADIKYYSRLLNEYPADSVNRHTQRSVILGYLGEAHIHIDQFDKANEFLNSALAISKRIGDKENEANWILSLGIVLFRKTEDEEALDLFEKIIAHPSYDYPGIRTVALVYAGRIHADLKHEKICSQYYARARALAEQINDKKLLALIHYQEGSSKLDSDIPQSIQCLEQGLQIAQECGFQHMVIMFLSNMGYAYKALREFRKSNAYYERSLNLAMDIKSRYNIALSFHNLGSNYQELQELENAKNYYKAALAIYQTIFQKNHGHIIKLQRGLRQVEAHLRQN